MARNEIGCGHLHLLGPTCVGKGYGTEMLVEHFEANHRVRPGVISVGDAVRDRFNADPLFREKYLPVVSAGDLVDDAEIIPMFDRLFFATTAGNSLCIDDGFMRNAAQVTHAARLGALDSGSATLILHASEEVCRMRDIDRAIRKGAERPDVGMFKKRFELHRKSLTSIVSALQRTGTKIIHIDANGDIKNDLLPQMIAVAECVLYRQFGDDAQHDVVSSALHMFATHKQQATLTI